MTEKNSCDAPSKTPHQTPADVLNAAADLLEKPGAWTQGAWKRGKSGREVRIYSPFAVSFSVLGAIDHVGGGFNSAIHALKHLIGWDIHLQDWNDQSERTQAEVVAKLREAAAHDATLASSNGGEK